MKNPISIFLLIPLIAASAIATEPIPIGSRLELMVDDTLIDESSGLERRLHRPTPHEVAIIHDEPWEGNSSGYHTVFQDGELYRMYYRGHQYVVKEDEFGGGHREVVCYAESTDGVHWTKPKLGLVDWEGSKENNIIWDGVGSHNFTPFIDTNPDCKPDEKYKAVGGIDDGLFTFKSTDGIHWSQLAEKQVITQGAFDSQNVGFWDVARGRYAAYFRTFTKVNEKSVRSIAMTTSPDFVNWEAPVALEYPGAPIEQLYTNQVIPYYRAPHLLLGFPTRYVDRPLSEHVKTVDPVDLRSLLLKAYERCGTDLTDGVFMTSRDGVKFNRWAEAFLRPGLQQKGNWIYGDMYQNWGIVETRWDASGEQVEDLENLEVPNELSIYVSEGAWRTGETRQRRYTLRIDGFVSLQARFSGGEFTTVPITFEGKELAMNYSTSAAGSVRVELQDEEGKAIEGYALNDCPEVYGDSIEQVVRWNKGSDVAALAGKPVRLRFAMKDADLYSFRFR
jgi:hypothetical protein